jgi:RNA polymerase sigma-70 factor (ECF subfamily)
MSADAGGPLQAQLEQAAVGDGDSWRQLVEAHHQRLRRTVALRLDPRVRGRVDPSDVLQEAYLEAASRLPEYLRDSRLPFALWLRLVVCERLSKLHRHHLGAQMRSAGREVPLGEDTPDTSSVVLADALIGGGERPSEAAARAELHGRLQEVLERMDPLDREALALRHFEQLSTAEAAQVLGISEAAASKRYCRALDRLRELLSSAPGGLDAWRP